jgi:GntP family gluconate:H+ symporter
VLEKTGAARKIADSVLRLVGPSRPGAALSATGWLVSIPVFCDSGFVLLSSLMKTLAKKTGVSKHQLAVALATGLYATHNLVPPTPGPIAAAGNVGMASYHFVWLIVLGVFVSFFSSLAGLWWSSYVSKSMASDLESLPVKDKIKEERAVAYRQSNMSTFRAVLPMLVPLVLIGFSSVAHFPALTEGGGAPVPLFTGKALEIINFLGHPASALVIGLLVAFFVLIPNKRDEEVLNGWMAEGLRYAATILVVTGAGGAFGAVIKASPLALYIQQVFANWGVVSPVLGLVILFVIAAMLKSAQGSSTAALIVTSTMVAPLLPAFGLAPQADGEVPWGYCLAVLAIGSGAMVVSHVNDSFFWVVSQFSEMSVSTAYRRFTLATLLQGLISLVVVCALALILI